ncbi:MAG: DUF4124 domain-containing protein [Burkholderiales bacterium]
MKKTLLTGLTALVSMLTAAHAAEIYRWVDERGVTQYSEKPPANRPAKLVDGRPAAASVDMEGKLVEPPKAAAQPPAQPQPQVAIAPPPPPGAIASPDKPVRGMDFSTFIYLQRGMSEGEVLLRAGRPDFESVENFRNNVVKSLYYYPTTANPFITIVTVRGGRVADIDRTRKTF